MKYKKIVFLALIVLLLTGCGDDSEKGSSRQILNVKFHDADMDVTSGFRVVANEIVTSGNTLVDANTNLLYDENGNLTDQSLLKKTINLDEIVISYHRPKRDVVSPLLDAGFDYDTATYCFLENVGSDSSSRGSVEGLLINGKTVKEITDRFSEHPESNAYFDVSDMGRSDWKTYVQLYIDDKVILRPSMTQYERMSFDEINAIYEEYKKIYLLNAHFYPQLFGTFSVRIPDYLFEEYGDNEAFLNVIYIMQKVREAVDNGCGSICAVYYEVRKDDTDTIEVTIYTAWKE